MTAGPSATAEKDALLAFLRSQRAHVLGALEELPDHDLRRAVLPSGWTPLGLVQHLTLDVERFWFRAVVAGETVELPTGDEGWRVDPELPAAEVLTRYRHEAELADAVIAATPLDAAPAWWPGNLFGDLPVRDLRRTVLAVTVETACHAGHLDVVRELSDRRQWLVPTD